VPMNGTWTLRVVIDSPRGKGAQDFSMTPGSAGLVAHTESSDENTIVTIDAARRQLIGVRTAPATIAPMEMTINAAARVAYDETSLVDVSLKVRGWITKLYADRTGQRVTRGQALFLLYSPDLYGAQQDFLVARGNETLAKASRERLRLLGMSDAQIDGVEKSGAPLESIAFSSPASGFVIEKNVVEGASVEPGSRLFRIAGLDKVWVEADVYETDFPRVAVGQRAEVALDYVPGKSYEGNVAYVYPAIDEKTRTGRARIELPNAALDLRPGMYARATLHIDLGKRLQIPKSAIVYTGPRRLVFVDLGGGRFQPRGIRMGAETSSAAEIVSGLSEGDIVATSGVFLIAAEARIRTAAQYWDTPDADVDNVANVDAAVDAATIYTCRMHPEVHSAVPGKCPKCGMELVPQ